MDKSRRRVLRHLGGAAALATFGTSHATKVTTDGTGKFPSGPLRFIVPVGPGSGADSSTRFVAERIGKAMGQPAVVENRPGGDFIVGVQALLSAPPDGQTLMLISQTSMVVNPIIHGDLPYKPLRDIRPLAGMVGGSVILVTGAASKFRNVADVTAAAREKSRAVSMGYYGHFYRVGGLMMEQIGKVSFSHVPYKGATQEINDLVGGVLDVAFMDVSAALPLMRSGRLRALAASGKTRHPALPELPTLDESGYPGFDLFVWVGYGVSSKVPDDRARVLQAALLDVAAQPAFRDFSAQNGNMRVLAMPGEELARRIADETTRFRALLEVAERAGP